MGRDRLIWRPNSIPLEEWDKLSRDEQIKWWRDRQPPPVPPPHPLKAVELYHQGVITLNGLPSVVFGWLTDANVGEFLHGCPEDLLHFLRSEARNLPADDDEPGWGRLVTVECVSHAPWVTPEEIERENQERQRRFRAGLRLFRAATRPGG